MPPEKLKEMEVVEQKVKQLFSDTQAIREKTTQEASNGKPSTPLEQNTQITAAAATGVELILWKIDLLFKWKEDVDAMRNSHGEDIKFAKWFITYLAAPVASTAILVLGIIIGQCWPQIAAMIKTMI